MKLDYHNFVTEKQLDYIATLAIDCNFSLAQRKAFIEKRVDRTLEIWSDISRNEASKIIGELIELKESRFKKAPVDTGDSDPY
jgi:hypothetical protein